MLLWMSSGVEVFAVGVCEGDVEAGPPEPHPETVTPTQHNQTNTVILKPSQRPNPTR